MDSSGYNYEWYDRRINNAEFGREGPDLVFVSNNGTHYVILEVDEKQHKSYNVECECNRMVNIGQSLGQPVMFIRYNPNKYKIKNNIVNPSWTARTNKLRGTLNDALSKQIHQIKGVGYLSFKQLFYDDYTEKEMNWVTIQEFEEMEENLTEEKHIIATYISRYKMGDYNYLITQRGYRKSEIGKIANRIDNIESEKEERYN